MPQLSSKCNSCGECLRFCPVVDFDFTKFYQTMFRNAQRSPLIGFCRKIYFGQTLEQDVKTRASGGGIVSTLLISALQRKLIDGAIVVKMDEQRIGQARVVVAENGDDILEASQSKYVAAPVNLVLKDVISKKGVYAFVGLPCHVHALRKLQADRPALYSQKIRFVIGLFCGSALCDNFLDFVLSVFSIGKHDVEKISFRHKRNPSTSSLFIVTKDNRRLFLDRKDYSFLFYLFTKECCLYCTDHTNEFADISVGDMRPFPSDSPNYRIVDPLQSVIIIRTNEGAELLEKVDGIELSDYDAQDLIASKLSNIIDKGICTHTRLVLRRKMGMPIPQFNQRPIKDYFLTNYGLRINPSKAFTLQRYVYELFWVISVRLMQNRVISSVISKFPLHFWKAIIRQGYLRFKLAGIVTKQR